MDRRPATVAEVKEILEKDLAKCDDLQLTTFGRYAVEPHFASIVRYGEVGTVVVVAEKAGHAVYWEDVEEGFNISPLGRMDRSLSRDSSKMNWVMP